MKDNPKYHSKLIKYKHLCAEQEDERNNIGMVLDSTYGKIKYALIELNKTTRYI